MEAFRDGIDTRLDLRHPDPEDRFFFFNRVISVISVVLQETTFTISNWTCETVSIESETVREVSLSQRKYLG